VISSLRASPRSRPGTLHRSSWTIGGSTSTPDEATLESSGMST